MSTKHRHTHHSTLCWADACIFCSLVQVQKFIQQSYIKEDETRLKAWAAAKSMGKNAASSKQFEVFKKKISEACPKPTESMLKLKEAQPKRYNRRIIKFEDDVMKIETDSKAEEIYLKNMMPVPRRVKTTLYDGFTREGKGRYQYLKIRCKEIPEKKYYFPLLNSWDYGWRLNDVIKKGDIRKPEYGRTRIITDTFYTRTAIPDLHRASAMYWKSSFIPKFTWLEVLHRIYPLAALVVYTKILRSFYTTVLQCFVQKPLQLYATFIAPNMNIHVLFSYEPRTTVYNRNIKENFFSQLHLKPLCQLTEKQFSPLPQSPKRQHMPSLFTSPVTCLEVHSILWQ